MKTKHRNKILIVFLIAVILIASHCDYKYAVEDREASEICRMQDTEDEQYLNQ